MFCSNTWHLSSTVLSLARYKYLEQQIYLLMKCVIPFHASFHEDMGTKRCTSCNFLCLVHILKCNLTVLEWLSYYKSYKEKKSLKKDKYRTKVVLENCRSSPSQWSALCFDSINIASKGYSNSINYIKVFEVCFFSPCTIWLQLSG